MSFSINTNVASLQAQQYLQKTGDFQQKTISRVTSGLRIVASGDDAAGLAIANGYRSDQAVLSQGIRNANDGLSQLQIVDGGMNNISQLLDRARTLATQSASGTFTGDRNVLNSEFSTVIMEIDRQAQSIGLNTGGELAKSLSVFVGGGKTSNGVSATINGSVGVDLSHSTIDAKSLGLKGAQAVGVAGTDIGTGSATSSVSQILANTTNVASEAATGSTDFFFSGPGFGDAQKVKVSVNLSGVTDTDTLVSAINNSIAAAGNGGTQAATAFKNANITASINTDATGKKQLAFNAGGTAFQVQAGDRVSNALMGNLTAGSTGKDLGITVAGATTGAAAIASTTIVRIQGGGLASPVDISIASGTTAQNAIDSLYTQVGQNAALQAAGIKVNDPTAASGALSFSSKRGETFNVTVVGDETNTLGLGTWKSNGAQFDYTSITGGAAPTVGGTQTDVLEFSVAGGPVQQASITLVAADTAQTLANKLNTAFNANAALSAAGMVATVSGGRLKIDSANGTAFRLREAGGVAANQVLGFATGNVSDAALGASASALSGTTTVADATNNVHFDAGGATGTDAFAFNPILYGQDAQTINLSVNDPVGTTHNMAVVLQNNATDRNGRSLDEAIASINSKLQQSNDDALKTIVAMKEYDPGSGTDKIKFVSTLQDFSVSLGQAGTGTPAGVGSALDQGQVQQAEQMDGGGTADISNQAAAQAAVSALADAVTVLGKAQAVVGRGENQFAYAVSLAQSQLTNLGAAESRIRDADLAAEAANMTKAQILLQAGIAALAQANTAPQQVLSLLRNG